MLNQSREKKRDLQSKDIFGPGIGALVSDMQTIITPKPSTRNNRLNKIPSKVLQALRQSSQSVEESVYNVQINIPPSAQDQIYVEHNYSRPISPKKSPKIKNSPNLKVSTNLAPGATSKKYSLSSTAGYSTQNFSNMLEIKPMVWLGNGIAASNKFQLQKLDIKYIVTIGPKSTFPPKIAKTIYLNLQIDGKTDNLLEHLLPSIQFMQNALATGCSVLVNCESGVTLSPYIMIGFLIKKGMTFQSALTLINEQSWKSNQNMRFIMPRKLQVQLDMFQKRVRRVNQKLNSTKMAAGVDHEDQMRKTHFHIEMDKEMTMANKNEGYAQNIESVAALYSKSPYLSISPEGDDSKDDSVDPGTSPGIPEHEKFKYGSLSQIKEQLSEIERVESDNQNNHLTFVENKVKNSGPGQSWTQKIFNNSSSGDFEINDQENSLQMEVDLKKIETALMQESKWNDQFMLKTKKQKIEVGNRGSPYRQRQLGLLQANTERVTLTQEDTEMLLGALMDLMISPKSLSPSPSQTIMLANRQQQVEIATPFNPISNPHRLIPVDYNGSPMHKVSSPLSNDLSRSNSQSSLSDDDRQIKINEQKTFKQKNKNKLKQERQKRLQGKLAQLGLDMPNLIIEGFGSPQSGFNINSSMHNVENVKIIDKQLENQDQINHNNEDLQHIQPVENDDHINIQENDQFQSSFLKRPSLDPEISKDTSHPTLPTVYNQPMMSSQEQHQINNGMKAMKNNTDQIKIQANVSKQQSSSPIQRATHSTLFKQQVEVTPSNPIYANQLSDSEHSLMGSYPYPGYNPTKAQLIFQSNHKQNKQQKGFLPKLSIQSIFQQQFANEVAMSKISDHEQSIPSFVNNQFSSHKAIRPKQHLRNKRHSYVTQDMNPIDLNILNTLKPDSVHSFLARKRSLASNSDLKDYKSLVVTVSGVKPPEYLSKLGGSPSYQEIENFNKINQQVISKDPMTKIKGSKAQLQLQYYDNLSNNFGTRNLSIKGHTGIEQLLIPKDLKCSRNRSSKRAVLKIPSNPIDPEQERFGSNSNKKMKQNTSKPSKENSMDKKEKSTGLELKKDQSTSNQSLDKTLKRNKKQKTKTKTKVTAGLDLSNSPLSPSPSQDLVGVLPKIVSPNIENISKVSSALQSPEMTSQASANQFPLIFGQNQQSKKDVKNRSFIQSLKEIQDQQDKYGFTKRIPNGFMSPRVRNAASYGYHADRYKKHSTHEKKQKELLKVASKVIKEATFDSDDEIFLKEQIDHSSKQLLKNQEFVQTVSLNNQKFSENNNQSSANLDQKTLSRKRSSELLLQGIKSVQVVKQNLDEKQQQQQSFQTIPVESLEELEKQKKELLQGINKDQHFLRIFKDHSKHRSKIKTTRASPTARTLFESKNNQMLDFAQLQEIQQLDNTYVMGKNKGFKHRYRSKINNIALENIKLQKAYEEEMQRHIQIQLQIEIQRKMSQKNADISKTLEQYQQQLQGGTNSPTRSLQASVDFQKPDMSRYFDTGWNKNDDKNYLGDSKSQFSPIKIADRDQQTSIPIQIQNDIIQERSKRKPIREKVQTQPKIIDEQKMEDTERSLQDPGSRPGPDDPPQKESTLEKEESQIHILQSPSQRNFGNKDLIFINNNSTEHIPMESNIDSQHKDSNNQSFHDSRMSKNPRKAIQIKAPIDEPLSPYSAIQMPESPSPGIKMSKHPKFQMNPQQAITTTQIKQTIKKYQ